MNLINKLEAIFDGLGLHQIQEYVHYVCTADCGFYMKVALYTNPKLLTKCPICGCKIGVEIDNSN